MPSSFTASVLSASPDPENKIIPDKYPLVGWSLTSSFVCCGGLEHQIRIILDLATFN